MDGPCHEMVRSVSPGLLQAEAKSSSTEVIQATQDSGGVRQPMFLSVVAPGSCFRSSRGVHAVGLAVQLPIW